MLFHWNSKTHNSNAINEDTIFIAVLKEKRYW